MFKKVTEAKSLQRLSGADKKKLKRATRERFPNVSDADIDAILPSKAEITLAKYPNRVYVYSIEGEFPMLFDADGRGTELFPTVYALWKVPDLLPAFLLKAGGVSHFIIGGADLMFPGISIPPEGLPSFLAGQPWSIKVPGNPAPIAVGTTTMSSAEALQAGLRGKALKIAHFYRDSLWESVEGGYVPNGGFLHDIVIEDPALISASDNQHDVSDDKNEEAMEGTEACTEKIIDASIDDNKIDVSEELAAELSHAKISSEELDEKKEQAALTTEEMDSLLDKCLLQALHTTVKDKDLPIPGSTLWSNHILPCRPPGVTLDVKKSSHKKLSKWLQSKSSTGLISVKEEKYKKETMLRNVNRGHQEYTSFRPEKLSPDTADQKNSSSSENGSQSKVQLEAQLEVVDMYKSSTHVNPIFAAVGADTKKYYTASEATDIAFSYVEKENLVKQTDKARVVLDAALCDALYKGAIKKGTSYPTEVHKKDIGATFINRMQGHHQVSRGNNVTLCKGSVKPIQLMTERRQGNKKVTKVSGIETFLLDADSLASELQKKFACSTSVAELPGKKGQHEVLVQGGVIDKLAIHIVDHYGVPKKYIEVLDKTKR